MRLRPGKSRCRLSTSLLAALLMLLILFPPDRAAAAEITIAAAADLTFVFPEIASRFQKETGDTVKASFGSSGNFFSQLQNGGPFDIFFSADVGYPKKLQDAGLVEPDTFYVYAVGKLVLWAPAGSTLDLKKGLEILVAPAINKISIANPEHAPYGRAAVAALKHEHLYGKVRSKLVMGENISQAAQFVQSGNAGIGILALSLALAPSLKDQGRYELIPASDYPPIEQAAVILKSSPKKETAKKFLAFIKSPPIVSLMRDYGFTTPGLANAGN